MYHIGRVFTNLGAEGQIFENLAIKVVCYVLNRQQKNRLLRVTVGTIQTGTVQQTAATVRPCD